MKIWVGSPDFATNSGGIKVLHYCMYLLQRLGHHVLTNAKTFNPEYYGIVPTYQVTPESCDMIIIPEIARSEPYIEYNIPILRWVLYFPGFFAPGPEMYTQDEVVFHWIGYEAAAIESSFHKESQLFLLPTMTASDYTYDPSIVKDKDVFYVYKHKVNEHAHPESAYEMTRTEPRDYNGYLRLLKSCNTFYCYDRNTQCSIDAYLCGAKVLVWEPTTRTWEEFIPKDLMYKDTEMDMKIVEAALTNFKVRWDKHHPKEI